MSLEREMKRGYSTLRTTRYMWTGTVDTGLKRTEEWTRETRRAREKHEI